MAHKVAGQIVGVEIQERLADMAQRSVKMNDLTGIQIMNADMRDVLVIFVRFSRYGGIKSLLYDR